MTETKSNAVLIGLLEAEELDLCRHLNETRAEIRRLELEDCPIKIGDIVKVTGGHHRIDRLYRVHEVDKPALLWVWANPQLASGAWSKGVHHLFGHIEKVPQP